MACALGRYSFIGFKEVIALNLRIILQQQLHYALVVHKLRRLQLMAHQYLLILQTFPNEDLGIAGLTALP